MARSKLKAAVQKAARPEHPHTSLMRYLYGEKRANPGQGFPGGGGASGVFAPGPDLPDQPFGPGPGLPDLPNQPFAPAEHSQFVGPPSPGPEELDRRNNPGFMDQAGDFLSNNWKPLLGGAGAGLGAMALYNYLNSGQNDDEDEDGGPIYHGR